MLAAVEEGDRLHRAVQQAAVVRDHQRGAGEAREPGLQPQRRFQVEVVGRLVEQQQVGVGEQRGGERHAHAPAAGEFAAPGAAGRLRRSRGRRGWRPRAPARPRRRWRRSRSWISARRWGSAVSASCQQCEALGVALQHGVEQGGVAGRGLPARRWPGGRGRQADVAAVERNVADDRAQQGGFAGTVAADQADAAAGVNREVGGVEQGAAAEADGGAEMRRGGTWRAG